MVIIPTSPARRADMFALLRLCLGERETVRRNDLFWGWKHEQNPFGPSLVLLGEESGQLVGLRAFLRWNWLAQGGQTAGGADAGQVYPAVRAVDTVTHPQFQRRGIFTQLTLAALAEARAEGAAFVFNTPNQNSLPGYLKMGWRQVARLPMQVRVLRPLRFVAGLLGSKLGRRSASPGARELSWRSEPTPVAHLLDQESALQTLIEQDRALRGAAFTTARSPAFLRWRYGEHPYVSYFVETVEDGSGLRGALIWRTNTRFGLHEVALLDLLLAEADEAVVAALVAGVRRRVNADYLIAHFGPGSAHRDLLRRLGFRAFPGQGMEFVVRSLDRAVDPDPFAPANWSLCLGDLEIF